MRREKKDGIRGKKIERSLNFINVIKITRRRMYLPRLFRGKKKKKKKRTKKTSELRE